MMDRRGRVSAGILLYRKRGDLLEVFLVHPGGPFWARKDQGAWSIAKGQYDPGEDALEAARREFREETGQEVNGPFLPLPKVKQAGGKTVTAWAARGEFDPALLRSDSFSLEWPPGSGVQQSFPEVDRGAWFDLPQARRKILTGQLPLLEALAAAIPP